MTIEFSDAIKSCYLPTPHHLWTGRKDDNRAERYHDKIICLNLLQDLSTHDLKGGLAFVGFACDEGVRRNLGRMGAVDGPDVLRKVLANLPVPVEKNKLFDVGNIICNDYDLELSQAALGEIVAMLLKLKCFPIILGGGHELAFGTYLGESSAYPNADWAMINCDAHLDLRPCELTKGTSGTSFAQIANHRLNNNLKFTYACLGVQDSGNTLSLFERAYELDTHIISAEEFHIGGTDAGLNLVDDLIIRTDYLTLSLCLDVFASAFAPGVSAPQPLGLLPWHMIPLVRKLAESGKLLSFSIAELCPCHDVEQSTAKLAASIIADFIAHMPSN